MIINISWLFLVHDTISSQAKSEAATQYLGRLSVEMCNLKAAPALENCWVDFKPLSSVSFNFISIISYLKINMQNTTTQINRMLLAPKRRQYFCNCFLLSKGKQYTSVCFFLFLNFINRIIQHVFLQVQLLSFMAYL